MLKQNGVNILGTEGYANNEWVLIDTPDVVIHIFYKPFREFYDLEGLWFDSPRLEIQQQDSSLISGK